MDVKVTTTPEVFDLPEWKTLLEQDPHRHFFQTPEYNEVWWDAFGEGKDLFVLTFLDPEPAGLAALMLDDTPEGRRIRFLGGDDLTDYLGLLTAGEERQSAVVDALLTHLVQEVDDWDYLDAKCMPVPLGIADRLVEAADRHGLNFTLDQTEVTAVLPLPVSFDEYLERLDGKNRHELKRKMRRLDRESSETNLVRTDAGSQEDLLDFFGLHLHSEGMKGKFLKPERATFFARLAEVFGPHGVLSLDFLEVDGVRAACTFSFVYDGRFYLYNSAYHPDYKRLSPGLILVAKLIERSIEEELKILDFLRGPERYKFDLGAEALPLHSVTIRRRD